jgi:hypothetical protein
MIVSRGAVHSGAYIWGRRVWLKYEAIVLDVCGPVRAWLVWRNGAEQEGELIYLGIMPRSVSERVVQS